MPRLAIHEPFGHGHGPNALAGLVEAARARGWQTLVLSPSRPEIDTFEPLDVTANEPVIEWLVSPKQGRPYGAARGRGFRLAVRRALEFEADLFVSLTLDYAVNSVRPLPRLPIAGALALHSSHHLDPSTDRFRSRLRARTAASNLRKLTAGRASIVVHSDAARDRVAECVGAARVKKLGWPVTSRHAHHRPGRPADQRLLFVGNFREEKGFAVLTAALQRTRHVDVLELTSPPATAHRQAVSARIESVIAPTGWEGAAEYHKAFERASVAVLPYTPKHQPSHISSALLDALSHGLPVVVTEPIAGQLPAGFDGSVVVPPDDPDALASGIDRAFADYERLAAASRASGTRYVLEHHSFEGYLDGLWAAAGLPRPEGPVDQAYLNA